MWAFSLFVAFLLQAPPPTGRVVVGLLDGEQVVVENPEYSGFIEGRSDQAVLMYRRQKVHGQIPTNIISRIEFGEYRKGRPFVMTVTLRNGQKVELESEHGDFVVLRGRTDRGTVVIRHPDPTAVPLKLTTKKPDRKKDLTIQYLEFPPS